LGGAATPGRLVQIDLIGGKETAAETGFDALALGGFARFGLGLHRSLGAALAGGAADAILRRNLEIHEQSPGILLAHGNPFTPSDGNARNASATAAFCGRHEPYRS
jgi:hypothetical protein